MGAVSLDKLMVIDMPHADAVKGIDWRWKSAFFPAENCDRQLLIGFADDLPAVPEAIKQAAIHDSQEYDGNRILIANGADAYKHLLRVACGMLDKRVGEKKTIEDIRSNWMKFISDSGEPVARRARFEPIVKAMFDDSSTIRARIFQDRSVGCFLRAVSSEPAVAARNLVRPRKGDNILLICEKEGITTGTFKVLDNCAGTLYLTHPEPAKCDEYANQFRKMGYKSSIEVIPYEEALGERLKEFKLVFNCQPMDGADRDRKLISAWHSMRAHDAMLVHLKGNPQERNATSKAWQEANVPNVFFIEDILRQKKSDEAANSEILAKADIAIGNCAASRSMGRRPVDKTNRATGFTHLLDEPSAYRSFIQGAVRNAESFRQPLSDSRERDDSANFYTI